MVVLLGIAYPIFLVVIGQITLPFQSNGSIIEQDGKKIGSKLISQTFESSKVLSFKEHLMNLLQQWTLI